MKNPLLVLSIMFLTGSCNNPVSTEASSSQDKMDSCQTAVVYPYAITCEQNIMSNFTGELNNYWGDDTSKHDFTNVFKNGELVESRFYYENGTIQEKYTFKCQSLHGSVEYYYDNGQLAKLVPYKYGLIDGFAIKLDSFGNETARVRFKNNSIVEKFNLEN
ncbi:MAG: toxin-antitoxin system YwqK family antitoxin [Crocinitomicaceae bacterium]